MIRLCAVKGCTGAAVALVRVKAPGWNVAESRRVCSAHRSQLMESNMGKHKDEMNEVTVALRSVLVEVDRFMDAELVADLDALSCLGMLRKWALDHEKRSHAALDTVDKRLASTSSDLSVARELVGLALQRIEDDEDVLDWTGGGRRVGSRLLWAAVSEMDRGHG